MQDLGGKPYLPAIPLLQEPPKVEQCSQVKTFNRKKSEKEQEKPSTPTIDILAELVERL